MKALIFSDSHGYLENIKKAINHFKDIKLIFHLGDFIDDARKIIDMYPDLKIYAVAGNNDFTNDLNETIIKIDEHTIFMTHGHKYGVYFGVDKIYYRGLEVNANIIFFGHSHKRFYEKIEDCLILNPGSISYPRDSSIPTFAIIEDSEDEMKISFFGVYKNEIIEI